MLPVHTKIEGEDQVAATTDRSQTPGQKIANRLKSLLLESGIEERQVRNALADAAGISNPAVAMWFDGQTKSAAGEHIASICLRYGFSPIWVYFEKGPKLIATDKQIDVQAEAATAKHGVSISGSVGRVNFYSEPKASAK